MNLKLKCLTVITSISFMGTSHALPSPIFKAAIENAYKTYSYLQKDQIDLLAFLVTDWVLHYEKAVTLGTSAEYTDQAQANLFNNILRNENQCSTEISLGNCARSLICDKKIFSNFWNTWNEHNCVIN